MGKNSLRYSGLVTKKSNSGIEKYKVSRFRVKLKSKYLSLNSKKEAFKKFTRESSLSALTVQ